MAAATSGDVLKLAHKLYAQTGFDRTKTVDALQGLGYSKADAQAAVDQVAPAPAETPPAPAPTSTAPARKSAQGGFTSKRPRTPPAAPSRAGAAPSLPTPTLRLPRRPGAGDVAGFGFGCLVYVLCLQYLKHGPGGPTGWLGAKFLNRPYQPADQLEDDNDGAGTDDPGLVTTRPTAPDTING